MKARVRPPSLVWEGIGGHLTGGVTAPTSPRITAMGVATTVNATAEAIFSQQIAGTLSTSSNENCRSDGVTPTLPTNYPGSDSHVSSSYPSLSYQPPSITRENSVLNSLECWDYSVELECLQGPNGRIKIELSNLTKMVLNTVYGKRASVHDLAVELKETNSL